MSDAALQSFTASFDAAQSEPTSRGAEPAWLHAQRKTAMAGFAELGLPTRRHEDWKYTNPARIANVAWQPAPAAAVSAADFDALGLPCPEHSRLVFTNGHLDPALSSLTGLHPEVTVAGLAQVLASEPERLEGLLPEPGPLADRAFARLAAAAFEDGALVHVPAGVDVEEPVVLVFLTRASDEPAIHCPRVLVVAEAGSRVRVIELHANAPSPSDARDEGDAGDVRVLTNALGEIQVGPNASVEHVLAQLPDANVTHLTSLHASVGRDARLRSYVFSVGDGVVRNDVTASLVAEGAECWLQGLYVATDGAHVDDQTTVDHRAPHGTSHELYKGVLSGKSRGAFSGKVIVRPDAQKTDAQQKNENLMLSENAEVDSKPQLEIEADDVRCSHGSTTGQLDADAVFYLRARGIDEAAARAMLTRGFAAEITNEIAEDALREWIGAAVTRRLFGPDGVSA